MLALQGASDEKKSRAPRVWITGDLATRVMVLVKATEDSEAGILPSTDLLEAMGRYNEELADAGVLLSGEGLQPSSKGKRAAFHGPSRTVVDGPLAATEELVAVVIRAIP